MAAIPSMSTNSRGRNAFRSQWINAYKFFRLVCQSIPGNCFLKENQLLHGVLITEKSDVLPVRTFDNEIDELMRESESFSLLSVKNEILTPYLGIV